MATRIGFTFDSPPTDDEVEVFEYFVRDYVEKTPGYAGQSYVSYVGVYFNANGTLSGVFVANSSTEQYG
jgi:hypothetical protein